MPLIEIHPLLLVTMMRSITVLLLDACGGDEAKATEAASQAVATLQPRNGNEFRLAARVVALNLHASHALAKAGRADTPEPQAARQRSAALAFIKEADKAEHRLGLLQDAPEIDRLPEATPNLNVAPIQEIAPDIAPDIAQDIQEQETAPQAAPEQETAQVKPPPPTKEELRQIRLYAQRARIPFAQALKLYQAAPPLDRIKAAA
jgi:hypothetical protein